ncbi:MAG: gluconate 2-dehydrogenase subunit 3 family protein [Terriglobia bacterium]|jgi:hypothetical protein
MHRRTVLKIVALSALTARSDAWGATCAAHPEERAAWAAGDYKLEFFTPAENELLDQAMEMIIPADRQSGGAHAAKVSLFADRLVSTGSDSWKAEWRSGLQLFQEEAAKSSLADALARAAAGEAKPRSDVERFFVTLKQMTVNGYYSSEIGIHQDLEYQGNTYVAEFPECAKRP